MSDKNEDFWRQKLTPEQYSILRDGQTEAPHTGKLLGNKATGVYLCGACETEVFKSEHKFDSGSGWPSFYDVSNEQALKLRPDDSHRMNRVEILCQKCKSHLGHVFGDAPQTPTNLRYCINSQALKFKDGQNKVTEG